MSFRRLVGALLLGLLLWAQPASAAIAFVSRVGASSSATATTATAATSHTTGNILIVLTSVQASSVGSIADTAGNTYVTAATPVAQGTNDLAIWYAKNITGHASNIVTVTWSGSGGFEEVVVYEFSGVHTTTPLGNVSTGTGNSTSPATGSITVTASEEVIVAFMEADGNTFTAGTGYTGTAIDTYFFGEYHIVTASEAASATSGSGPWGITAASFKTAGGGAATSHPCSSLRLLGVGC